MSVGGPEVDGGKEARSGQHKIAERLFAEMHARTVVTPQAISATTQSATVLGRFTIERNWL